MEAIISKNYAKMLQSFEVVAAVMGDDLELQAMANLWLNVSKNTRANTFILQRINELKN